MFCWLCRKECGVCVCVSVFVCVFVDVCVGVCLFFCSCNAEKKSYACVFGDRIHMRVPKHRIVFFFYIHVMQTTNPCSFKMIIYVSFFLSLFLLLLLFFICFISFRVFVVCLGMFLLKVMFIESTEGCIKTLITWCNSSCKVQLSSMFDPFEGSSLSPSWVRQYYHRFMFRIRWKPVLALSQCIKMTRSRAMCEGFQKGRPRSYYDRTPVDFGDDHDDWCGIRIEIWMRVMKTVFILFCIHLSISEMMGEV